MRAEPDYYVHHRLMVAGYRGGRLFTPMAMWLMQRNTNRIPRLINIVAHKALLSAYGKGKKSVDVFDVLAASNDTASLRGQRSFGTQGVLLLIFLGACLAAFGWAHLP